MKAGVNEYIKILEMAKSNTEEALTFCQSVQDEFYRAKSYAATAYFIPNVNYRIAIYKKSLEECIFIKNRQDRNVLRCWPLRHLADLKQDKLVENTVTLILEELKVKRGTVEYLDALYYLMGALGASQNPCFDIVFQEFRKEAKECTHNKLDLTICRIIGFIDKINPAKATDLIFEIQSDKARKKAEKTLKNEANKPIEDYFLELQFKEIE